jgi:glycosyltransferase involved in cell wall biosynthesis
MRGRVSRLLELKKGMGVKVGSNCRLGIIQRVFADYRKPFFEKLAEQPGLALSVFAGQQASNETIRTASSLESGELYETKNLYFVERRFIGFVCWQCDVTRWLRTIDPDLLILDPNPRMFSNWVAVLWMKRRRRKVLGWGLGELERSGPIWFQRARSAYFHRIVASLDGMIAYSSKAAEDFGNIGVDRDKIFIAYNAIDNSESERYLESLEGDLSWVKGWKESLEFDVSLPVVLFVGRLIHGKRIDLLIKAMARLRNRCQLLIVGDGPARPELEMKALAVENRVRFVGHQTGETLARCFIGSDVFVLPGAGGLAVHQAMSYGKPVVVSFGDGTESDLVREGENGSFFRSGDWVDLERKIEILLDQPKRLTEMGRKSLSIIQNERSLDAMVASFMLAVSTRAQKLRTDPAIGDKKALSCHEH